MSIAAPVQEENKGAAAAGCGALRWPCGACNSLGLLVLLKGSALAWLGVQSPFSQPQGLGCSSCLSSSIHPKSQTLAYYRELNSWCCWRTGLGPVQSESKNRAIEKCNKSLVLPWSPRDCREIICPTRHLWFTANCAQGWEERQRIYNFYWKQEAKCFPSFSWEFQFGKFLLKAGNVWVGKANYLLCWAEQHCQPLFQVCCPSGCSSSVCFLAWFPVVAVTQCSVCRLSCQPPVPNGTVPLLFFIYYFYINLFKEPCWEAALFVSFLLLFHKLKKKSFPAPASFILPFPFMMSPKLWQEANIWHAETPLHSEQDAGTKHT